MNRNQMIARCRSLISIPVALVAAGFVAGTFFCFPAGVLAEEMMGPEMADHPNQAASWTADVQPDQTIITLDGTDNGSSLRSALAVLPASTKSYQIRVLGNAQAQVEAPEGFLFLRGSKVLRILVETTEPGPVAVAIEHDGNWLEQQEGAKGRLWSSSLHGGMNIPDLRADKSGSVQRGSYVIVHGPAFTNTIAPLVDWKTRKGFEVVTVSTGVTGSSSAGILAYLQEAYNTWDNPPEYILLMGDVGDIPTYNFYGNPSDLPYILLDGDDWLPDAMIGRLPVENGTQAETVINKIVAYERNPFEAGENDWFTRSIMVGGVEGSDTPPHTVRYCGQQLQKIGFSPAQTYLHPPLPSNMFIRDMFNGSMDIGASIVAYRGWAYGTSGWSDPRYEVNDMGGMNNQGMMPVVMSFVCLNGDYTASSPCFGEAFLRLGLPDELKGGIAFIGNGEHWSHTRYNDAMAISFFERIINPEITDLGTLMNASKMRFYDYFPHEVDAETYGEESVEFYFHIYNLLGDPELNFWKSTPKALDVEFDSALAAGDNFLEVVVNEADVRGPLAGAIVTVVRDGVLLATARTDEDGSAWLRFAPLADGDSVDITVTGPGLITFEGQASVASAAANITLASFTFDDGAVTGSGNGDGTINPGESLAIVPTMTNNGLGNSGAFTVEFVDVTGPASLASGSLDFADLASGQSGLPLSADLQLDIDESALDGDLISVVVEAERSGESFDFSLIEMVVTSAGLGALSVAPLDGSIVTPGQSFDLAISLIAEGSVGSTGGSVELELVDTAGATLNENTATFGSIEAGATVISSDDLVLELDNDLAVGTSLTFLTTITTNEGWVTETTSALVVGPVDVASVSGPDGHGYYAYDSADLDYPAQRPVYRWNEISTAMGGSGTQLAFPVDNEIVTVQVDLPFDFRFYGTDYSRIRVSDNGWIAFDLTPHFNFYNWPMPSEHGNNAVIAPYWENLVPTGSGGSNGIAPDGIYYHHDATAGTFTVQWSRLHHYKPQILGLQTFQVVLLDPAIHPTTGGDGEMLFYYREVTNNDYLRQYATVGIESADGRDGLQLSYASINDPGLAPLQPGLAIKVTTEAPVRIPFALSSFTASNVGSQVQLNWSPADDRPVIGWHVDRLDSQGVTRLTEAPISGALRQYMVSDPQADKSGDVRYRLTALHPYGSSSQPGEVAVETGISLQLALHRASPNPSRGHTSIAFALPEATTARLRVYDTAGRLVRTLIDGPVSAGDGFKMWDGRDDRGASVAGGVYFYRLDARGETLTRKLILVR